MATPDRNNNRRSDVGGGVRGQSRGGKDKDSLKQEQADGKKEDQFTTCMHLPKNRLYLIPFYDYYILRDAIKNRPEFENMRKSTQITEHMKKLRTTLNKNIM